MNIPEPSGRFRNVLWGNNVKMRVHVDNVQCGHSLGIR